MRAFRPLECFRRVASGGECGAPRGQGGRNSRRSGVLRETFQPGDLTFPRSLPPARAPRGCFHLGNAPMNGAPCGPSADRPAGGQVASGIRGGPEEKGEKGEGDDDRGVEEGSEGRGIRPPPAAPPPPGDGFASVSSPSKTRGCGCSPGVHSPFTLSLAAGSRRGVPPRAGAGVGGGGRICGVLVNRRFGRARPRPHPLAPGPARARPGACGQGSVR